MDTVHINGSYNIYKNIFIFNVSLLTQLNGSGMVNVTINKKTIFVKHFVGTK